MQEFDDKDEAETLAFIRRGLADVDAGRTVSVEEAFKRLEPRYAPKKSEADPRDRPRLS